MHAGPHQGCLEKLLANGQVLVVTIQPLPKFILFGRVVSILFYGKIVAQFCATLFCMGVIMRTLQVNDFRCITQNSFASTFSMIGAARRRHLTLPDHAVLCFAYQVQPRVCPWLDIRLPPKH